MVVPNHNPYPTMKTIDTDKMNDANPDPISGEAGSHPVGTGVGAAAGGCDRSVM